MHFSLWWKNGVASPSCPTLWGLGSLQVALQADRCHAPLCLVSRTFPAVKTKKKDSIVFPLHRLGRRPGLFSSKSIAPGKQGVILSVWDSAGLCSVSSYCLSSCTPAWANTWKQNYRTGTLPFWLWVLNWSYFRYQDFFWLLPCTWDDLLFILMEDLPVSPVQGSLNSYLNLLHDFTKKSWLPTVCEANTEANVKICV